VAGLVAGGEEFYLEWGVMAVVLLVEERLVMERRKKICSGYSVSGGGRLVVVLTNRGRAIGEEANNKVVGGCIS